MDLLEGYIWREEKEWKKIAQQSAWIMSMHSKRPITVEKLLKKNKKLKKDEDKISPDEKVILFENLEARLGAVIHKK